MKDRILVIIIAIVFVFKIFIITSTANTGWVKEGTSWKYYNENSKMLSSTCENINGEIYGFGNDGYMLTGWRYDKLPLTNSKTEVMIPSKGENWYFFNPENGSAYRGWNEIDGKWHYFDENGRMIAGEYTPDGKYIDYDGVWNTDKQSERREGLADEDLNYQVIELLNDERQENGKRRLRVNTELMKAAATRARELESVFSHDRPDGRSYSTIFDDYSIEWTSIGENLAYQHSDSPAGVMSSWMKSEHHAKNILNPAFGEVGVGTYSDGYTRYWVQLFKN